MADNTAIQWTDATFNPVTGCTKVSPGCAHCYIEKTPPFRKVGRKFVKGNGESSTGVTMHWDRLDPSWSGHPAKLKGHKIFTPSLSDIFHEDVTDEFRDKFFATIALHPEHVFQVLTKRPEQMLEYFTDEWSGANLRKKTLVVADNNGIQWQYGIKGRIFEQTVHSPKGLTWRTSNPSGDICGESGLLSWPLPNLWLGVSVENQYWADRRIPLLLQTPAAVRFVSYEPAVGAVDFLQAVGEPDEWHWDAVNAIDHDNEPPDFLPENEVECDWVNYGDNLVVNPEWREWQAWRQRRAKLEKLKEIDWLIIGGESGHDARPFKLDWARQTRDACKESDIAFFCKQLGSVWAKEQGIKRDSMGGNMEHWPEDLRVREFPAERSEPMKIPTK